MAATPPHSPGPAAAAVPAFSLPGNRTALARPGTVEPYDSCGEEREDAEIAACYFPTLFDAKTPAETVPRGFYEDIDFYLRQRSVQRRKAREIKEHPYVHILAVEDEVLQVGKEPL
ncbi:hypothetical protein Q9L58_005837 [Maublancomyces gigas]|uniref:Uncharacterized protein n=1 Tax=Discina gigas TaxID=1032678 RepID=A0ABR3GH55_9PEZI